MQQHYHFKIFKPYGYISQLLSNDIRQARKKKFLSELYDFPENTMAIGRLDEKSEGLLLLTTDGKISDTINRSGIEKEYYVQVDGLITDEAIQKMREGVFIGLDGGRYKTKPCAVARLVESPVLPKRGKKIRDARHGPSSWATVTLREGKFRQVRKMTSAVGFPTLRLVRVRIGNYHIASMYSGEVIKIEELQTF